MKKKCLLLSLLFLLTCATFCIPCDEGTGPAGNQRINSQVVKSLPMQTSGNYASTFEDVLPDNRATELRNPTFEELRDFLLKDTTSRKQFVLNHYECRHFTTDLNNAADALGIRCAFVLLCFRNGQHAVAGFETIDRGMVYIEPQTDARIEPVVGGRYQEQEIMEILVSW